VNDGKTLSGGVIGGIVGGAVGLLLLLGLGVFLWRKRRARRDREDYPLP
jgi:gas vesicle protein